MAIVGCKNLSAFDVATLLEPFQCGHCQVAFSNIRLSLKNVYQCQLDRWCTVINRTFGMFCRPSFTFTLRNIRLCCFCTKNNFYLEFSHKYDYKKKKAIIFCVDCCTLGRISTKFGSYPDSFREFLWSG